MIAAAKSDWCFIFNIVALMNEVKSIANNTEIPLLFFVKYTGYERKLQPAIAGNPCIYVKL